MKKPIKLIVLSLAFALFATGMLFPAGGKASTVTCVGIYSETSDGYVSYREAEKTAWVVVKVGDVIPTSAEIKINVDRDWVEFVPSNNPTSVYELDGPASGEIVIKVSEIVKGKARIVSFPKGSTASVDPKYKDKLVVQQYLGRQIYVNANGDSKDIKYGDVLDIKGKVRIIAINNTITLMNASGKVTTVIGPLNFTVEQVLKNESLYKFLNVQK